MNDRNIDTQSESTHQNEHENVKQWTTEPYKNLCWGEQ